MSVKKVEEIKKVISSLLLICIVFFACPTYSAAASVSDFSDVSAGSWYYQAVNFVTRNGMFNGTSSQTFSPDCTMTRGMFVTVLGRYGGVSAVSSGCSIGKVTKSDVNMRSAPSTDNTSVIFCIESGTQVEIIGTADDLNDPAHTWYYVKYNGTSGYIRDDLMELDDAGFTDVPNSEYYYSYVQWAYSSGIASATGNGTFSPERAITREEICSMLYNYAHMKNYQLDPTSSAVHFSDSLSISSDYCTAVSSLQQVGVINGYDDGSFRPKGSATRAEVSIMLMRFIGALGYEKTDEASYDAYGNYIFGTEVPVKTAVSDSYFSDACFIGHSLVCGMKSYFGLTNTDFFAVNSSTSGYFLSSDNFELSGTHTDADGNSVHDTGTLNDALSESSYKEVYIMFGVNEIGSSEASRQNFYSNMSALVDLVRKSQPDASIYLLSLTPVSQKCSESRAGVNRDNIIDFNTVLKQACRDKRAYYLNVFDLLCDDNGFLSENACMSDGIHLLSSQYAKIKNYIMTHTV